MYTSTFILLATAAVAPLASAIGVAKVVNNCDFEVTVWSVGGTVEGNWQLGPHGGFYGQGFHRDPVSGGVALKVTRARDGLYTGAPQTIFSYSLDGANVWYDLSSVFGNVFTGSKLVEKSAEASCPSIVWPNGTPPSGSQVKVCTSSKDVVLTLCAA